MRAKFEVHYLLEQLKWNIVRNLSEGKKTKVVLEDLKAAYKKVVIKSEKWETHYCWIKLLGDLFSFRPIIFKEDFKKLFQHKSIP